MKALLGNLRWGIRQAAALGVAYGLWATVCFLLGGAAVLVKNNLRLSAALLFYILAPVLAGLTLGLTRPLNRFPAGRAVSGFLVAFVVCAGGYLVVLPRELWEDRLLTLSVITAAIAGPIYAAIAHDALSSGGGPRR